MDLLRSRTGRIAVGAHRGASGYAPENTLAAFRLAHEQRADVVELDVHLSSDDRLVVIHDDTLDRTTEGRGYVRDHTWDEIARLSAGAWFGSEFADQRVPLLEDVLDWAQGVGQTVTIELKRPNEAFGRAPYPGLAARVMEPVRARGLVDRVVLFSDDHGLIRDVRALDPDVTTAIILGAATFLDPVGLARQAGANGVYVYWRFASRRLVDACHAASIHVFGTGVSDDLSSTRALGAMLANGTDFVSGGRPDRLRAFVEDWLAASPSVPT